MAQSGFTPISIYYSTTASAVPTAANLVQGELAINTADGKLYYEDSAGVVQVLATKSTGSIGGSNTQVQFNNSGSLGGSSSFTWDGTTVTATKFAGALNGTVGATTASTGAFTTLTSNGATTFTAGTASTSTTTGTTVITGGLGVSGRINAANFDGIVGANTAAAGSFTTINASTSITNAGLTSGRVTYAGASGLLQDDANFTFNGTTVTMANDASISGLTVGKGGGAVGSNSAFGPGALSANTTGAAIVAIGYQAFATNTTGSNSTAVGYQALVSNTTASDNTAVGYQAGYSNTTGNLSVAIGTQALYSNTTGVQNSAIGWKSLYSNTTGNYNSAFGLQALTTNTTGSNNTALGQYALSANTTASSNTAVGYQAGYTNTVGQECAYIGGRAGYSTTGGDNTFVGYNSGNAITSGYANTILGKYTGNNGGLDIRTANNYIVLSDGSGNPRQIIDGSGKVGIGTVSPSSLLHLSSSGSTGQTITSVGTNVYSSVTLINTTTGYGYDIGFGGSASVAPNSFYLYGGSTASVKLTVDASGIVTMGAYGAGAATFSASGVISSVSDETWKTKDGVPTNTDAMLQKLEPGYWFYNEEKAPIFGEERQLGFYAQNVHEAIGAEAAPTPEEGKPWGYYDRSVLAVAVMSLKNALNTIEELKQRITVLENK